MISDQAGDASGEPERRAALPHSLASWGWTEEWAAQFAPLAAEGRFPARVIAQHRGRWTLAGEEDEWSAALTGRLRHEAREGELPAVGDWVACVVPHGGGPGRIDAVLPRRSSFVRRAAGSNSLAQTVAANVDTLFIASSLNADLNPRRLERYVAMARESGAKPVLLLTKDDLVADGAATVERLAGELRIPVVALSSHTGAGVEDIRGWLVPGETIALVGSSGVGKSSLLNHLAGEALMLTRDIRQDDGRGRHTTTHRELFRLPGGSLMLDTPGVRELGLWDADQGLADTFTEILDLADGCRYRDCHHEGEPGCAVQAAIRAGLLDESRLDSYRRLGQELAGQPTDADRREAARQAARAAEVVAHARARRRDNGWRER
jgi:ribosome biogenesis GTPase / thiamine phosphate phosphatase